MPKKEYTHIDSLGNDIQIGQNYIFTQLDSKSKTIIIGTCIKMTPKKTVLQILKYGNAYEYSNIKRSKYREGTEMSFFSTILTPFNENLENIKW